VVRAFLAQAVAGILATRAGRKIFPEIARGHPVHLVAGSDAVAATRGDSATGDSRLARGSEVQPERARLAFESERLLAAGMVKSRGALTTIVPADKKLIHGMRDGIMIPTSVADLKSRS